MIRLSPERWWLSAGLTFTLLIVGLTNLAPVLLLPIFYSVKPLDRDALRARLLALAERAGARVLGAYEWGLGEKTRKANAALAGLGGTRRILVSDTMLAEFSDDEIEVVLAHEIAHHVHGDIWKGIAFESALIVAGFYLASLVLQAMAGPAGLRGVDDVAGLPLLLLAAGAVSLVMVPAAHAMSRGFERNADRFALDLTQESRARSSRRCAASARRTSPRRIPRGSCSGCSTAIRPSANASPPRRPSKQLSGDVGCGRQRHGSGSAPSAMPPPRRSPAAPRAAAEVPRCDAPRAAARRRSAPRTCTVLTPGAVRAGSATRPHCRRRTMQRLPTPARERRVSAPRSSRI